MVRRDDPVVIEAALNGVHSKEQASAIPITPDEIASDRMGRRVATPAEAAKRLGFPRV